MTLEQVDLIKRVVRQYSDYLTLALTAEGKAGVCGVEAFYREGTVLDVRDGCDTICFNSLRQMFLLAV